MLIGLDLEKRVTSSKPNNLLVDVDQSQHVPKENDADIKNEQIKSSFSQGGSKVREKRELVDLGENATVKTEGNNTLTKNVLLKNSNRDLDKTDKDMEEILIINKEVTSAPYVDPTQINEAEIESHPRPKSKHKIDEQEMKSTKPIINFNVVHDFKYLSKFDSLTCENNVRQAISQRFTQPGAFDFNVEISTSYKILYIGDSVGMQFSQSFQEVAGATTANRKVLRYSWGNNEGIHIASPVRGGGAVGSMRITGMFSEKMKNNYRTMPNNLGGGWMEGDVANLKRALAQMTADNETNVMDTKLASNTSCAIKEGLTTFDFDQSVEENESNNCAEDFFDVVIHQFPFGWVGKPAQEHITYESIHEAVQLSKRYFGAKTVILQTVPVNNNVIDMVGELEVINNRILNYSTEFQKNSSRFQAMGTINQQVEAVLVLDLGQLSVELFAHNAAKLHLIDIKEDEIDQAIQDKSIIRLLDPILAHRTRCCHKKYGQIIGFSCSRNRESKSTIPDCFKTRYSKDGMHWCMDEVSGRINGGIACLLNCVGDTAATAVDSLKRCEKSCNKRFMSLQTSSSNTSL